MAWGVILFADGAETTWYGVVSALGVSLIVHIVGAVKYWKQSSDKRDSDQQALDSKRKEEEYKQERDENRETRKRLEAQTQAWMKRMDAVLRENTEKTEEMTRRHLDACVENATLKAQIHHLEQELESLKEQLRQLSHQKTESP